MPCQEKKPVLAVWLLRGTSYWVRSNQRRIILAHWSAFHEPPAKKTPPTPMNTGLCLCTCSVGGPWGRSSLINEPIPGGPSNAEALKIQPKPCYRETSAGVGRWGGEGVGTNRTQFSFKNRNSSKACIGGLDYGWMTY